jgi:pilus assembly protein FimV
MSRKLISLGILSLILAPSAAFPLGLGDIRLNSHLNQPMNAEIPLSIASRAELDALQVELAPQELFRRHGLDRPAYFDDLRFRVQATGATTAVIQVSSTRPITEPFVTFLLEARWSGGRILREYTVLLDPPVFMPSAEAAAVPAPVRPPPVVETPRPAPAPAPAPAARPEDAPAPAAAPAAVRPELGDEYSVQRNDTLWGIAQRLRPDESVSVNQIMVALFRENPHAFDGNINRLRSGTILRVPSRQQMAVTSSRDATAEVLRQTDAWRSPAAVPAVADRRLELAPPADSARPPALVSDPVREPPAPSAELLDAVQALRSELAETRSLMEIKDAEIAALQARLADIETAPAPLATPLDTPALAPAAVAPAVDEAPARPVTEGRPAVVPPAPEPTLLDRATILLGNLWLWLVLAVLAIFAAAAIILRKRQEHERSIEYDLAATGTWGTLDEAGGKLALATAAAGAAGGVIQPRRSSRADHAGSILVEESAPPAPRGVSAPTPARSQDVPADAGAEAVAEEDYRYPFEDTIAGETGINLDQADPLAEADFHMAYGLYDQAAEIIKKAIEREPERYELRRKLMDICFVWGNASEFLAQAEVIQGLDDEAAGADWAKIAIMGRQICPDEPMFQATTTSEVDVDLGGDDSTDADGVAAAPAGDWLDFDVGESEAAPQPLGDTREQPAPSLDALTPDQTAELNLEELGLDLDLGESGEHALLELAERAPELPEDEEGFDEELAGSTLRLSEPPSGVDTGAAPADEEGGGTMMLDPAKMRRAVEDPTQRGEGWELDEDDPTFTGVDGFEEEQEAESVPPEKASDGEVILRGIGDADEDDESDRTLIRKIEPSAEAPTMEVGGFEDEDEANLDLDELTQSLRMGLDPGEGEEEAAFTRPAPALEPEPEEAYELDDTAEMPPSEMDEIGTKLDLARAYIDMGDPDGARSILGEVVDEGDEGQRDEARQLLDTLA